MGNLLLALTLVGADPQDGLAKKMLPIYLKEAEAYSLAVESAPKMTLELKKEPVFEWLNEARGNTQGVVFVWLRDGRPAALACIFSYPHEKLPGRTVMHELHALDREKLVVKRDEFNKWEPQAGLARKELPDAPLPADTPAARLVQMKQLAQEFGGNSIDLGKRRWQLRLLPTPLYRYPAVKTGVIDGALFALVSTAGTDPEVLFVVEAREKNGKVSWEYALGRFSDWELRVERDGKEVFSSVRSETNTGDHDSQHLYRVYPERVVTLDGKLLARVRQKVDGPWEFIPAGDK